MSARINKACDGCRVRKVKCNGTLPCSQCAHLDLPCAFSPPSGKRKPGVRNRLVEQLREKNAAQVAQSQQQQHHPQSQSQAQGQAQTQHAYHLASSPPAVTSVAGIMNPDYSATSPSTSNASVTSPGYTAGYSSGYTPDFFLGLLPDFENIVYPVNPIVTPAELRVAISNMHHPTRHTHEDAALVYSFAAVTVNLSQTSSWTQLNGDVETQVTDLMHRSLIAHRMADLGSAFSSSTSLKPGHQLGELPITVKRIMTCVFLEISMMAFRLFQRSFVILREAISLVQSLKVYALDHNSELGQHEVARRQRLYWECFIHERFVNIMSGCPAVLPPLSTGLPIPDASIPVYVDVGWRRLISLFRIMDDSFVAYWTAQQDPQSPLPSPMTAQWVEAKQAELDAHEHDDDVEDANGNTTKTLLTELQHADLFITRLWLRTLVWQLALSHGLLRSALQGTANNVHTNNHGTSQAEQDLLSLHFPAQRLSAQLRRLVSRLDSVASIGTHGSGILQKLFEITTTVADVLALPPGQTATHEDVRARVEDFVFLVGFLFRFERISKEERAYMRDKVEVLQGLYTTVDFGGLGLRAL